MSDEILSNRQRELAAASAAAARRLRAEVDRTGSRPAEVGDVFVLETTSDFPVEWALLDRRGPEGPFLAVPGDSHPFLGSRDLEVGTSTGLLTLRCQAGLWLEPAAFDPDLRLVLLLSLFGPEPGIVVEEVRQGSTGARAGLQKGDVLLSWIREGAAGSEPASGTLRSPFHWRSVLIEQVPRGKVALLGRRGETAWTWSLPGGAPSGGDPIEEEVATRPGLTGEILSLYSTGRERIAKGELEAGIELWREAAARARDQGDAASAFWLSVREARAFAGAERWLEADSIYEELIEPLEAAPLGDSRTAQLLREWGRHWSRRRIWDRAEDCYRRALAVARKLDPESLAVAWSLTDLGELATRSGGTQDPDELFYQALELRQRLAPGSSDAASSWRNLGTEALTDGDFRPAEEKFRKALTIQERATPNQIYVAEMLLAVAAARYFQKDFQGSEKIYQQALAIVEREAPEDLGILGILQGVGAAASGRGDWRKAEKALLRAVDLGDRLAPASREQMRFLLYDLGQAQWRLGKKEDGTCHLCRSLELVEGGLPRSSRSGRRMDRIPTSGRLSSSMETGNEGHAGSSLSRRRLPSTNLALNLKCVMCHVPPARASR